jgi:hypothetical protein
MRHSAILSTLNNLVEQNMMEGQTTNTLEALKSELISTVQKFEKKNVNKGNLTDLGNDVEFG